MRRFVAGMMALAMVMFVFSILAGAQEEKKEEVKHQYVGASKCKVCHKSEAKGDQYGKWEASKHSKAFADLASEQALTIAKEKGIDNPQTSDQCLVCHVTAFSAPADEKADSYDQAEGVGCESCHGPGSDYKKMTVMKDRDAAMAAGLVMPTEETCVGCHNEKSPTFKSFDFAEAVKVIAHPYPKEKAE